MSNRNLSSNACESHKLAAWTTTLETVMVLPCFMGIVTCESFWPHRLLSTSVMITEVNSAVSSSCDSNLVPLIAAFQMFTYTVESNPSSILNYLLSTGSRCQWGQGSPQSSSKVDSETTWVWYSRHRVVSGEHKPLKLLYVYADLVEH